MFYYKNWDWFCGSIKELGLKTCTAHESLEASDRFIVLKHDVETNPYKALRLAEIEHRHGINGSYYVQACLLEDPKNVEIFRQMKNMGHEISYHYDVLDANSGDFEKAERDFARWVERFRDCGFIFKTICQHGNPIKKRVGYTSNRDFFRNPKIKSKYSEMVDMVVDYSNYVTQPYIYISDAGYMWKHITEPETNDLHPDAPTIPIRGGDFEGLIRYIKAADSAVVLSTHPHRWEEHKLKIKAKIFFFRIVRSMARCISKMPFAYNLLNKFYFLARKI